MADHLHPTMIHSKNPIEDAGAGPANTLFRAPLSTPLNDQTNPFRIFTREMRPAMLGY